MGTLEATMDSESTGFGHIPRNIKATLALIEAVKPTVFITEAKNLGDFNLEIKW